MTYGRCALFRRNMFITKVTREWEVKTGIRRVLDKISRPGKGNPVILVRGWRIW